MSESIFKLFNLNLLVISKLKIFSELNLVFFKLKLFKFKFNILIKLSDKTSLRILNFTFYVMIIILFVNF